MKQNFLKFVLFFIPLVFSSACQQDGALCYSDGEIEEGSATVNYDDVTLNFIGRWMRTGSTLQINLEGEDIDSMLTIRLIETTDGISMDALGDTFPYAFALGETQSSSATFYPPSNEGSSATAQAENPGVFSLVSFDEQILTACFSFTAVDQQGNAYKLDGGLINATKNDLGQ